MNQLNPPNNSIGVVTISPSSPLSPSPSSYHHLHHHITIFIITIISINIIIIVVSSKLPRGSVVGRIMTPLKPPEYVACYGKRDFADMIKDLDVRFFWMIQVAPGNHKEGVRRVRVMERCEDRRVKRLAAAMLLDLKVEEGATSQGKQCLWKVEKARKRIPSWSLRKEQSPANTSTLAQ